MLVDHLAGRVINVKRREKFKQFVGYNDNQKTNILITIFSSCISKYAADMGLNTIRHNAENVGNVFCFS